MAKLVRERGVGSRISVINNFDPWYLEPTTPEPSRTNPRLRLTYAGNLGRFQALERLYAAIDHFRDNGQVEWQIVGEGPLRAELEALVRSRGIDNVTVHGYLRPQEVAAILRNSTDLGLVSLNPGVLRAAYPSKTLSYVRHSVPVLALAETDSQLARQLASSGAGWSADPRDPTGLEDLIAVLAANPERVDQARENARRLYEAEFERTVQLRKWELLFDGLAGLPGDGHKA
jgi:glycosyltransferase involved in cell wall biosynthesis